MRKVDNMPNDTQEMKDKLEKDRKKRNKENISQEDYERTMTEEDD